MWYKGRDTEWERGEVLPHAVNSSHALSATTTYIPKKCTHQTADTRLQTRIYIWRTPDIFLWHIICFSLTRRVCITVLHILSIYLSFRLVWCHDIDVSLIPCQNCHGVAHPPDMEMCLAKHGHHWRRATSQVLWDLKRYYNLYRGPILSVPT